MKVSFDNTPKSPKRKPNLIETDDGPEIVNKIFFDLLNKNNIKKSSRYTSLGVLVAERFTRTIRDLLKKSVFERVDVIWIDVLSTITKQYINWVQSSVKLTLLQASLKNNEDLV